MIDPTVQGISDIANDILDTWDVNVSHAEALEIAVKLQLNKILAEALVIGYPGYPSVLEKISMILENK
jgi:hypothetical protein